MHLIATYLPFLMPCAFSTSEKVPSPFFPISRYLQARSAQAELVSMWMAAFLMNRPECLRQGPRRCEAAARCTAAAAMCLVGAECTSRGGAWCGQLLVHYGRPRQTDRRKTNIEKGTVASAFTQTCCEQSAPTLQSDCSARRPAQLDRLDRLDSGGSDSDSTLDKTVTR